MYCKMLVLDVWKATASISIVRIQEKFRIQIHNTAFCFDVFTYASIRITDLKK